MCVYVCEFHFVSLTFSRIPFRVTTNDGLLMRRPPLYEYSEYYSTREPSYWAREFECSFGSRKYALSVDENKFVINDYGLFSFKRWMKILLTIQISSGSAAKDFRKNQKDMVESLIFGYFVPFMTIRSIMLVAVLFFVDIK